jgi:hypothetical protein
MPAWVRGVAAVNPLSYEVNALRKLLLGLPGNLWVDFGALTLAAILGVALASGLLGPAGPLTGRGAPARLTLTLDVPQVTWTASDGDQPLNVPFAVFLSRARN